MRFVIIGGDAAGLSAASRAKRSKPDLDVVVLEKTNDVSFSACGMPYNIADPERDIQDLVVRRAEVFREKQGIDLRLGHLVEKIDRAARTVTGTTSAGEPFEVGWDRLLIATGASPIVPSIPGADLPGVFTLKALGDGGRIKDWLREEAVSRAVVVGGGYIGLEMCEALRARGVEVAVVELSPRLLPWAPEDFAKEVVEELARHGVELHAGERVEAIAAREGGGLGVRTSASRELDAEMVLLAIGVRPNAALAAEAGLELGAGGAIAVDRSLRTSDPDIYAAGDCADAFHVVSGERVWIPLALRANRAGWAVADMVSGRGEPELAGVAGTAVFKVFDLEVARTGLTEGEARAAGFEPASVTIRSRSRAHAHPGASMILVHLVGDRPTGKLLGCQMLGKEGVAHRINAPAVALHAGMTVADYRQIDSAYAPPFGPTWDPTVMAANQLIKKL